VDLNVPSPKNLDLPEVPRVIGESKRESRFNNLLNVTPNLSSADVYNLEKFESKL